MCSDKLAVPQIKGIQLQTNVEYLTPQLCTVTVFTPTSHAASVGHIWHVGIDNVSKQSLAVIPVMWQYGGLNEVILIKTAAAIFIL